MSELVTITVKWFSSYGLIWSTLSEWVNIKAPPHREVVF